MNAMKRASSSVARYAMAMGHEALSSASMHDATEIERQSEVGTKKGGSIEWRVCSSSARRDAPPGGSGRGLLRSGSLAVLLAAAGPDEVEGVAVLDEVGVDRDGEARIVQLD